MNQNGHHTRSTSTTSVSAASVSPTCCCRGCGTSSSLVRSLWWCTLRCMCMNHVLTPSSRCPTCPRIFHSRSYMQMRPYAILLQVRLPIACPIQCPVAQTAAAAAGMSHGGCSEGNLATTLPDVIRPCVCICTYTSVHRSISEGICNLEGLIVLQSSSICYLLSHDQVCCMCMHTLLQLQPGCQHGECSCSFQVACLATMQHAPP